MSLFSDTLANVRQNKVISINLDGERIGPEGVVALAEALKANSSVTEINLKDNYIGPEGAVALAEALKVNSSVTSINLWCNSIGDEGIKALAEAFKVNSSVTSINLWGNFIGDEGIKALAEALKVNSSVTAIQLGHNEIDPEGAVALAEALKVNSSVTYIHLNENYIRAEGAIALAEALKVNSSVTSINLDSNKIGPEGAVALAEALKVNSSVTSIDLRNNQIGYAGAGALAEFFKVNSSVTSINLGCNSKDDEGAVALAEALKVNSFVTEINLQYNSIGDAGAVALAEALKVNSSVTAIHLEQNKIGDAGAVALAEALKVNSSVTAIHLGRNEIGPEGVVALAEALKVNSSVTAIHLGRNEIGPEGVVALAEALKVNSSVTAIHLGRNEIGPEGVAALAEALKVNNSVTFINLDSNKIGPEGAVALAEALKENSSVTEINLQYNSIGPEGAVALAEALKANSAITKISLWNNEIGDAGAVALAEALKANNAITEINLWNNKIGDAGVVALAETLKENSSVTKINLVRNETSAVGEIALSKIDVLLERNKSIKAYKDKVIEQIKLNNYAEVIEYYEKILELTPNDYEIYKLKGNAHNKLKQFSESIECYDKAIELKSDYADAHHDKSIVLRNIGKYEEAIECVEKAITFNSENSKYILYKNELLEEYSAHQAVNEIIINIANGSSNISLNNKPISSYSLKKLCEALKGNNSVTKINLWSNKIGDEGVVALAEALKENSSVTSISLCDNEMGVEGAIALAEVLKANSSITEINLWNNEIGDSGAIALAEALKENSSVTGIYLAGNKIGDEGVVALAEVLKENSSVTMIDLVRNETSAEGAIALSKIDDLLARNKSIKVYAYKGKVKEHVKLNNHSEVIKYCEKILELNSNDYEVYIRKGNAHNKLKQFSESILCYNEVIALKPDCAFAYNNKGKALHNLGEYREAIECYNKAIALKPDYANAYFYKSVVLRNIGNYEEAIECVENAITLKSENSKYILYKNELLEEYSEHQAVNEIITNIANGSSNISLNNKRISSYSLKKLCEALKGNSTVTEINLPDNKIGADGAIALAEVLKVSNSIAKINLSMNEIGDSGAIALAEALKVNSSVTGIYLAANQIGNEGAVAIAEALKVNNSVTEINLCWNKIGDSGLIALAEALKENSSITKFQVVGVGTSAVGEITLSKIDDLLERNKSIKIYAYKGKVKEHVKLNNHSEVIKYCEKILDLNSNDYEAYKRKGNAHNKLKQFSESILCYDRAIALNPDDANNFAFKAIALICMDQKEEAVECFKRSKELDASLEWDEDNLVYKEKLEQAEQELLHGSDKAGSEVGSADTEAEVTIGQIPPKPSEAEEDSDSDSSEASLGSPLEQALKLFMAVRREDIKGLKKLSVEGYDLNSQDSLGQTILHISVKLEKLNVLESLLTSKKFRELDKNKQDNQGNTALHYAIDKGDFEIISILLSAGVNPNIVNDEGDTILSKIVKSQDLDACKSLLSYKDLFNMKVEANQKALEWFRSNAHYAKDDSTLNDEYLAGIGLGFDDEGTVRSSVAFGFTTEIQADGLKTAEIYIVNKKYSRALETLDGIIDKSEVIDAAALLMKIRCLYEMGNFRESQILCDEVIGNINITGDESLISYLNEAELYRAKVNIRLKNYGIAKDEILDLIERLEEGELKFNAKLVEASCLYYLRDNKLAEELYASCSVDDLSLIDVENLNIMGNIARYKGNFAKAKEYYVCALVKEGYENHPLSLNNLGLVYLAENNLVEALNYFNNASTILGLGYEDNSLRQVNIDVMKEELKEALNNVYSRFRDGVNIEDVVSARLKDAEEVKQSKATSTSAGSATSSAKQKYLENIFAALGEMQLKLDKLVIGDNGKVTKDSLVSYLQARYVTKEAVSIAIEQNPHHLERISDLEQINADAKLKEYFDCFSSIFNQNFIACMSVVSGRVQAQVTKIPLKEIGDILPIPVIGDIISCLGFVVNEALEIRNHKNVTNLANLANSVTELEALVELIARKHTLFKSSEIQSLTESSSALSKLGTIKEKLTSSGLDTSVKKAAAKDVSLVIAKAAQGGYAKEVGNSLAVKIAVSLGVNDLAILSQIKDYEDAIIKLDSAYYGLIGSSKTSGLVNPATTSQVSSPISIAGTAKSYQDPVDEELSEKQEQQTQMPYESIGLDPQIGSAAIETPSTAQAEPIAEISVKASTGSKCCTVMRTNEIKYDNPLIAAAMRTGNTALLELGLMISSGNRDYSDHDFALRHQAEPSLTYAGESSLGASSASDLD